MSRSCAIVLQLLLTRLGWLMHICVGMLSCLLQVVRSCLALKTLTRMQSIQKMCWSKKLNTTILGHVDRRNDCHNEPCLPDGEVLCMASACSLHDSFTINQSARSIGSIPKSSIARTDSTRRSRFSTSYSSGAIWAHALNAVSDPIDLLSRDLRIVGQATDSLRAALLRAGPGHSGCYDRQPLGSDRKTICTVPPDPSEALSTRLTNYSRGDPGSPAHVRSRD